MMLLPVVVSWATMDTMDEMDDGQNGPSVHAPGRSGSTEGMTISFFHPVHSVHFVHPVHSHTQLKTGSEIGGK